MLRTRTSRLAALGATVLLVLIGAWIAFQTWKVNSDLTEAVAHAEAIQTAVEDGDEAALDRELAGLRDASARADDRTSGLTWGALTHVPVLGDDAEGIQVTSSVLRDLADDGIAPLADVANRVDTLMPRDGAVDAVAVRELAAPVAGAQVAFADADRRLADVDPSGFTGRLQTRFADFHDQVERASRAMHTARIATELLPGMLGQDEPRRYLLAFQNNAEVRGAGGLPGAVSYIRAEDGRLSIERHVRGGIFPEKRRPVLPLSAAERELYGEVLGTYFVDAVMTPDVPRAAALMRAHAEQLYPGQPLDGVILVDTVAMAYLLEATGPLTVDGVRLTRDNVVEELLHRTYLRLDAQEQDAFFADVAAAAFEAFTGGIESPETLVEVLARATDERRIFLHSFDAAEQERIAGSEIAGELVTDPDVAEPQIAVTVNDTTGSKMSYFLRYDVDVQSTSCVDGVQTFAAKARLRSLAPPDAARLPRDVTGGGVYGVPPGHQIVTLRIFGPVGGDIDGFELNAGPMDLIEVDQDGRPVGMTYLELKPGQTIDLAWRMTSGAGQTGPAALVVTPTIEKSDYATSVESACR